MSLSNLQSSLSETPLAPPFQQNAHTAFGTVTRSLDEIPTRLPQQSDSPLTSQKNRKRSSPAPVEGPPSNKSSKKDLTDALKVEIQLDVKPDVGASITYRRPSAEESAEVTRPATVPSFVYEDSSASPALSDNSDIICEDEISSPRDPDPVLGIQYASQVSPLANKSQRRGLMLVSFSMQIVKWLRR